MLSVTASRKKPFATPYGPSAHTKTPLKFLANEILSRSTGGVKVASHGYSVVKETLERQTGDIRADNVPFEGLLL